MEFPNHLDTMDMGLFLKECTLAGCDVYYGDAAGLLSTAKPNPNALMHVWTIHVYDRDGGRNCIYWYDGAKKVWTWGRR